MSRGFDSRGLHQSIAGYVVAAYPTWATLGRMPQPLPRAFRRQLQALDMAKIDRIVGETVEPEPSGAAGATSGGDSARLRGLPAVSRHTSGAVSAPTRSGRCSRRKDSASGSDAPTPDKRQSVPW